MARKQSVANIFHTELKNKIAFGQSKHADKANLGFGESSYKIYSYSTYNTYLKECEQYAKWLKEEKNINKITDIKETEKYAKEYIEKRLNDDKVSVYTAKLERSAISMLYNKQLEIDMPKRDNKNITRSRLQVKNDKYISEDGKYKDVFVIGRATGGRRADLSNLRVNDFVEKDGHLYVKFIQSKGGRDRLSPVRDAYAQEVKEILEQAKADGKTRLFEHIPKEIDIHSLRRDYATNLYKDITENKELRDIYLSNYPKRQEKVKRDIYKDRDNNIYDRNDLYVVSQALGHNRLDVSVTHYLKH